MYTLNTTAKTVGVVNLSTGAYVTTITLAVTPVLMAVNQALNTVYVTTGINNSCIVIAGATNTITTTVSLAGAANQIAVNSSTGYAYIVGPTTSVYVLNCSNNTYATQTVYASCYSVYGNGPYGIVVDAVSNKVYILYNNSGLTALYLCVFSGTTYSTYATVSTTSSAWLSQNVTIMPGSTYALVSYLETTGGLVTMKTVNTGTYAVSAALTGPGLGTATSTYGGCTNPVTGMTYVSTNLGLVVVNGNTGVVLNTIILPSVTIMAICTSSNTLYTYQQTTTKITVIDGLANMIVATVTPPYTINSLVVTSTNILGVLSLATNVVNILTFLPLSTFLSGSGGLIVVSGGNKLQSGTTVTNTSYVATITFPIPFNTVPVVSCDSTVTNSWVDVTAVSLTAFSVYSYNATGTGLASVPFGWSAIGT
jgi:hypothetical protein